MITANQPFGDWNKVFPDPAMTVAAIDRLVHHATIFEMNVESYRRRTAIAPRRRPRPTGSPATVPPDRCHPDCRSPATIRIGPRAPCQRQSDATIMPPSGVAGPRPDCHRHRPDCRATKARRLRAASPAGGGDRDRSPFTPLAVCATKSGTRVHGRERIAGIRAAYDRKRKGCVGDVAGERADGADVRGLADAGDAPGGRLDAVDTGERRGDTDGATAIAASGDRTTAGRYRDRGAAGGPSGVDAGSHGFRVTPVRGLSVTAFRRNLAWSCGHRGWHPPRAAGPRGARPRRPAARLKRAAAEGTGLTGNRLIVLDRDRHAIERR